MFDNFQISKIDMYKGLVFLATSKKCESAYQLAHDLINQGVFYYVRYTKHSPVFYCFKTKEDYYALPQKFEILRLHNLKKLRRLEYRQSTIYDFGA